MSIERAWAVRPYPDGRYRVPEFLRGRMAAIGWPASGDLTGLNRTQIATKLRDCYYASASAQSLGQVVGIVDRFVNQIQVGDGVVVPDGDKVYFGRVASTYSFHRDLQADDEGYPHWVGVNYCFDGRPLLRAELPAVLFDALKGRQTVFGLPAREVAEVVEHPERYCAVDAGDGEVKATYGDSLSRGVVPGINSPRFEEAVCKVLSYYFPELRRLPTTNAPVGDTDLRADLPGGIVVRVQVKCYQDAWGPLTEAAIQQLRDSMELGEHGIIVTTNKVSPEAMKAAEADATKPIGVIDGVEFAQLVFDQLDRLENPDLWALGLRRAVALR